MGKNKNEMKPKSKNKTKGVSASNDQLGENSGYQTEKYQNKK